MGDIERKSRINNLYIFLVTSLNKKNKNSYLLLKEQWKKNYFHLKKVGTICFLLSGLVLKKMHGIKKKDQTVNFGNELNKINNIF